MVIIQIFIRPLSHSEKHYRTDRLLLPINVGTIRMSFIDELLDCPMGITYLSGANNYTWLNFANGRKTLISKPLRYFETRLDQFIRVHKTALINPQFVRDWIAPARSKMAGTVRMNCGTVLPVGRRRWRQFIDHVSASAEEPVETKPGKNDPSVIIVTDSQTKASWVRKGFQSKFANCLVNQLNRGEVIPDLLLSLPDDQLPALILLDACSSTTDRMNTLRSLKETPRLASIPTLLLVPRNTPETVNLAYAGWANSVVTVLEDQAIFTRTMAQLGHFWFHLAALPSRN
ncbi:response regulator transcription factor [Larkinella sp. C7]|uniref:response regulator transcription factor n=1 Tax=Larkinella sp. C7 TaxID=2576607 RepID=UPI001E650906|nr:LytTR family transcriptional regulator DNA-binding domain-containing protein [Larkinella sp. C7]